ncbi:MAG: hypothetical protein GC154_20690 [bacterium]|nr:hypothetical protein [bacterium]
MKKLLTGIVVCGLAVALSAPFLFAAENAGDDAAKDAIKAAVEKIGDLKEQTVCPLSGKPVVGDNGAVVMGYKIGTCCPNCAKAVEKDPLTALMKLREKGEEPKLAEGFTTQTKCPMSGEAVNADIWVVKNNALVKFCCPDCAAAFEKDPEKGMAKLMESKQAPIVLTIAQTKCPISGEPIQKDVSAVIDGKKVYFCCPGCDAKFKEDSAAYFQKLADEGVVLENAG